MRSALTWLDRKWWGLLIAFAVLVWGTWEIIWRVIEPLGIPETFETVPSFFKHRVFYQIVLATLIPSYAVLAIALWRQRRRPPETETSQGAWDQAVRGFCDRIAGHWWERIYPDNSSALSFLQMEPDLTTNTIRMTGRAFDLHGALVAMWNTEAACVNRDQKKVFYYWKGRHPQNPNDPYEGIGEIKFFELHGAINTGSGFFSDTNLIDLTTTTKKSVEFRRSTDQEEAKVMYGSDNDQISSLVLKKLQERW
jgi:hypothetical protein